MSEPPATMRPRYEELTGKVGVFREPAAQALRGNPLQQLWREHMLSRVMIESGLYDQGRFIVIYPSQNNNCHAAVNAYSTHLASDEPAESGFQSLTLESCLNALRAIGDDETATALHERYLDFERVERAIFR